MEASGNAADVDVDLLLTGFSESSEPESIDSPPEATFEARVRLASDCSRTSW
jgi:hypothetical protein